MFLVWYHYLGSLQDNTIFNSQLLSEGSIWMYLTWHFSDDTWLSIHYSMFDVVQAHHLLEWQFSFNSSCHFLHLIDLEFDEKCTLDSLIVSFCPPRWDKQSVN